MSNPPPLQPKSFYHTAAQYGALIIPLGLVLSALFRMLPDPAKSIMAMFSGLLLLSAPIAGIIGLCGIPQYGTRKLLWKSLVAILLPLFLLIAAFTSFNVVRTASVLNILKTQVAANVAKDVENHKIKFDRVTLVKEDQTVLIVFSIPDKAIADLDEQTFKETYEPILIRYLNIEFFAGRTSSPHKIRGVIFDRTGAEIYSYNLTK